MPLARARDYLSIGEVLDRLRPEFPDVSISKIRFLEAEGLISPERTGSKYRKFYEQDVARLRYILALQRDQFLPLRVIKERLSAASPNGEVPGPPVAGGTTATPVAQPDMPDLSGMQMTRSELAGAAGLNEGQLKDLVDFGILPDGDTYQENDFAIAQAAAKFLAFGVEARHLRMFKQTADREASFIEQIVLPASRRRDREQAEKETARSVQELVALSRQVREALLRAALRDQLT